ncbi:MAG: hypothetical protein AAB482_04440 [Patescibacteria group bacterium]|mgnify:CR=1
MADEQEYTRAQQLRQAQRKNSTEDQGNGKSSSRSTGPKKVSIPEGIVVSALLGLAFDLPSYLIAFIPLVGWIIGGTWAILGKAVVLMWLAIKGHLTFDTIKKGWLSLGLCSSLFVLFFVMRQEASNQLASGATSKV